MTTEDIEGHTYAGDGLTDQCERCGRPEAAHPAAIVSINCSVLSQERHEAIWTQGFRAAWTGMLERCVRELGYQSNEASKVAWISERERTIATLRMVCEQHGDNDWPDDLNLADVIEKHLDL
jgi:hypothetical protein